MQPQAEHVGIDYSDLAALKSLALMGANVNETKISCTEFAQTLDVSAQTASRRLQTLEDGNYITRDQVSDGQWVIITDHGETLLRQEYEDFRKIFERPDEITLTGEVTSGMGEGRHYISLSGYMEQFIEKLGYEPFLGTLNLELTDPSQRKRSGFAAFNGIRIDGWEDKDRTYGPATCYPATVEHDETQYETAHIIIPDRTHHDESQLEVIAPEKLRDVLQLDDGDTLTIYVKEQ